MRVGEGAAWDLVIPAAFSAVLSVLIAIVCVNRILEHKENLAREERAAGGVRKAATVLTMLAELVAQMKKATATHPIQPPKTFAEFFDPELAQDLVLLDFTAPYGVGGEVLWADHAEATSTAAQAALSSILDTYGAVLPSGYAAMLDELRDDDFLSYVGRARRTLSFHGWPEQPLPAGPDLIRGTPGYLHDFITKLAKAIECHNSLGQVEVAMPVRFFRDEWAPLLGTARVPRP